MVYVFGARLDRFSQAHELVSGIAARSCGPVLRAPQLQGLRFDLENLLPWCRYYLAPSPVAPVWPGPTSPVSPVSPGNTLLAQGKVHLRLRRQGGRRSSWLLQKELHSLWVLS
eukprot:5954285-Amphidinium_carterae.1